MWPDIFSQCMWESPETINVCYILMYSVKLISHCRTLTLTFWLWSMTQWEPWWLAAMMIISVKLALLWVSPVYWSVKVSVFDHMCYPSRLILMLESNVTLHNKVYLRKKACSSCHCQLRSWGTLVPIILNWHRFVNIAIQNSFMYVFKVDINVHICISLRSSHPGTHKKFYLVSIKLLCPF